MKHLRNNEINNHLFSFGNHRNAHGKFLRYDIDFYFINFNIFKNNQKMSKQLFELMKEQESFPVQFGKKDYISRGKEIVNSVLESGDIDKIEFWTKVAKIKETINAMDAQLRESISLSEKTTLNGVEFNPTNGGFVINYDEDEIYRELKKDLKDR